MASLSIAPSLEYHSSEDTEATFKNKINDKGFCVAHPDVRVRIKKMVGDDIIESCPKCQALHDLDIDNRRKNEKMNRAIAKAAYEKEHGVELRTSEDPQSNPIHGQPPIQGLYVAPVLMKENFSSSCFNICGDPCICLFVGIPCCFPIAAISYADSIGISDTHGFCGIATSVVSTVCWPCGLLACHEKMLPCFATSLVKRAMEKHHISNPPGPLGDGGCCGCWLQVVFCAPCTLCMLHREAKQFPVK
jgi:hypothetical protein